MPDYLEYPIETDPDALRQDWIDDIQSYWPNWTPSEGALAYRGASALIEMIAEGRDVASLIPDAIFRTIGASLFNIPANPAVAATATVTIVAIDDAGYGPLPADTVFSINGNFFELDDDVNFPSGTTTVGPVGLTAIDAGEASNGGESGDVIELEEGYEFVASVTLVTPALGGQDPEDIQVYQSRLRTQLTLMSPRAITTTNLVTFAQTVPGVYAAIALKGYDPDTDTDGNAGVAAMALRDATGMAVPVAVKDTVRDLLTGPEDRLANNVIKMMDPVWTPVDISFEFTTFDGADPATVKEIAEGAGASAVDPSLYGLPQSGEDRRWTNKNVISLYDIAGAIDAAEGLDRIVSIKIGLNGGAQVEEDVNLPGKISLPLPGNIVGTWVAA